MTKMLEEVEASVIIDKCNNRWICLVIMAPLVLEVVISNFTKVINDIGTIIWGK